MLEAKDYKGMKPEGWYQNFGITVSELRAWTY